jgi:hypothetical protein
MPSESLAFFIYRYIKIKKTAINIPRKRLTKNTNHFFKEFVSLMLIIENKKPNVPVIADKYANISSAL